MPQRDIPPFTFIYGHKLLCSAQKPFVVTFSRQKIAQFLKKKTPGILNFDAILFLFSFANSTPFKS